MARDYTRFAANPVRDLLFPERLARGEYFARSMLLNLLVSLPLLPARQAILAGHNGLAMLSVVTIIFLVSTALWIWGVVIPRLRDLGWDSRWAWLMILPFVNIVLGLQLLFTPGQTRRY